jgi:hypothetical protein
VISNVLKPLAQHLRIDTGSRDCRADAHDHDHAKREEDPLPQLGNLENIGERGNHSGNLYLTAFVNPM